jgi:hypothetical protein
MSQAAQIGPATYGIAKDDESLSDAELLSQTQQVARESKKHCRVTATRVLQKWSAVKATAARLQKKCGVYHEQTIGHRATTIHDRFPELRLP